MVADVGPTAGIQRITYRVGKRTGHLTVIVSRRTAYMRGDTFTLRELPGLPARRLGEVRRYLAPLPVTQQRYAADRRGRDVRLHPGSPHARPDKPRERHAHEDRGQAVVGVRGSTKVQGGKVVRTIWVAASGKPLLAARLTTAPGVSLTITYSRWNKPVHVSAPRDFIDADTGKPSGHSRLTARRRLTERTQP